MLIYIPGFLQSDFAAALLQELSHIKFQTIGQREVEWFSSQPFAYTGIRHQPNPKWPPLLLSLANHVNKVTGFSFNSALVNLYKDGGRYMPWHCDDSINQDNTAIASCSLADTREFHIMDKKSRKVLLSLPLVHGSLVLMLGQFQKHFLHSIPLCKNTCARYNVTLRVSLAPVV